MRVAFVAIVALGIALRVWRLGYTGPAAAEACTAGPAPPPFAPLFVSLRPQAPPPPLDYLLRAPLARAGASDIVLRLPSFVFSCGALVLFAWWMRARGF